mmetsp:Transcript_42909/g.124048  ORF Transcript_42909/g.124048 Transcript_42909/m.124048 type:complete len:267 (-) Transcript_42909:134-934(-)
MAPGVDGSGVAETPDAADSADSAAKPLGTAQSEQAETSGERPCAAHGTDGAAGDAVPVKLGGMVPRARLAIHAILFALFCFLTLSRVTTAGMMMMSGPVWEGYTGEQIMAEVCNASRTNEPRGAFKVDKLLWPPGLCNPSGRYKAVLAFVSSWLFVLVLGGDRGFVFLVMLADGSGTLLEQLCWVGGSVHERLGTTVLMWPYLLLATVAFVLRPANTEFRGGSFKPMLKAVVIGCLLRVLLLCLMVEGPTMRGRSPPTTGLGKAEL